MALGGGLGAVTLIGSRDLGGPSPVLVGALLAFIAVVGTLVTIVRGFRLADPFLDPRLFRSLTFSSAALVSLLTGYAFATAIIGGAVFVDRVLYGGPDQQRFALGALAACNGRRGARVRVRGPVPVAPPRHPHRTGAERRLAGLDGPLDARRSISPRSPSPWASSGWASV